MTIKGQGKPNQIDTKTKEVKTKLSNNDFNMSHLNAEQKKIAKIVMKVVKDVAGNDKPSGGGCKAFYTPKEWKERGEKYGTNSKLVLVYDGGDLYDICSLDAGYYSLHDYLVKELSKAGYFFEGCTNWYGAVYKD